MEFLKEILGDDLYSQVENKVNAYNGDEANKDKQIKIANLASGEYISKNKYSDLESEKGNIATQLSEAQKLIEDLKKASKSDEGLQAKVTEYEKTISDLQKQNQDERINFAAQLAIMDAKGLDVGYLLYKLREQGELELGEDGKIKDIDTKMSTLKTQCPTQFESPNSKIIEPQPLPKSESRKIEPNNLEAAIEQAYNKE